MAESVIVAIVQAHLLLTPLVGSIEGVPVQWPLSLTQPYCNCLLQVMASVVDLVTIVRMRDVLAQPQRWW